MRHRGRRTVIGRTNAASIVLGHAGEALRFAQADGRDGEGIVARVWSAGEHYGHVGMAATSCWQVRVGERVRFGGCGNLFGLCRGGSKVARVHMCGNVSTRSDHRQ
jgi:hypothetical protein